MTFSRRSFLSWATRALAVAGSGLGRAGAAASPAAAPSSAGGALGRWKRILEDPPHSAKPMTRWWWFGGAVTPEEITRELTFMRDAGLRGAEVQPVYPLAVDDPRRGIRHLRYFTEEWFEVLRHASTEARRLGLQLDFTLGSGWPYGGPFIPTNLGARRLRLLTQDLAGPRAFSWHLTPQLTGDESVIAVVAAPVGPGQEPDLARAQVLADQPRLESAYNIRNDAWVRDWSVPAGEWRLLVVVDSPSGQQVKRPTLGMEGIVLDHHSREAMALFLRAAGDRVLEGLRPDGTPPFHSVFCDSLEVYGADWTTGFLAEFKRRRGYDLAPGLFALWQEAGPETPHLRHDYHLTLSELTLEYFFTPLVAWAERNGMKARIQAHGANGDVMRAYGLAHIPEGENIFGGDRYMVNLRHRRLAASAAHLYGRPLVSAETYTWLRTPLYMTTLEMMKAATDSVFLDGINHVVNHGYSYSPPQAGAPGWAFYASTEVNHTNTWWRHYPYLARYVQRAQSLLQQGVAVNPVAVYLPLSDIYARFGAGSLHLDNEAERRLGTELLTSLRTSGYDFDLVNDHALATQARIEGGALRAGTAGYAVIIVPEVRWMPPESAARLRELAMAGGHVLFVERLPEGAAGGTDREARSAEVRRSLDFWGGRRPDVGDVAAAGRGSVALVADRSAALARLQTLLAPDFLIVAGADGSEPARQAARDDVGFVHRRDGAVDCYFVANVSEKPHALRVQLAVGHRAPVRWNAEGGTESRLDYAYVSEGGRKATEVDLRLDPFESCFIAFGPRAAPPAARRRDAKGRHEPPARPIEGPWTLRLGDGPALSLDRLRSWDELPEGRTYSGWATYETEFDVADPVTSRAWALDLGTVHETAEVWLNGKALGAAWKRPRRLPCGEALVAGRNRLKVEVANLWIHHVAAQPPPAEWKAVEETVGARWGRYGEVKPDAIPPAGLLGPVRLVGVEAGG